MNKLNTARIVTGNGNMNDPEVMERIARALERIAEVLEFMAGNL